jgi:hypothetical protein
MHVIMSRLLAVGQRPLATSALAANVYSRQRTRCSAMSNARSCAGSPLFLWHVRKARGVRAHVTEACADARHVQLQTSTRTP